MRIKNSPLEQYSNKHNRQDPQENANISRQNFKEKQDILHSLKFYFLLLRSGLSDLLLITIVQKDYDCM